MIKKIIPVLALFIILLVIASLTFAVEGTNNTGTKLSKTLTKRAVKYIDVNQIRSSVMNNGTFTRHPVSGNSDMEWPKGSGKTICYNAGIWIAGKVNDVVRTACSDYNVEFQPGNILEDGTADDPSKEEYRVYKVHKNYPNGDADVPESIGDLQLDTWADWQTFAENQGAPPVQDENGNWIGFGDEMVYAVMNDLDINLHNGAYNTLPIGIELHLLVFAFDRSGALGNTIFIKYTIINKGENDLNEAYIGAWADVDNGDANDDLIGYDLDLGMSYCYGGKPIDAIYGSRPPALGWDFFRGPIVDSPGDVAKLPDGTEIPDKKILGATSFNKYYNTSGPFSDPSYNAQGSIEVYNFLSGNQKNGEPWVNPFTGEETTFLNTGNPVDGTGWLSTEEFPPADIRMLTGSGPFVLAVGDTQEIVLGCVIGQGSNRLSSIDVLRFYDQEAQQAYNLGFRVPSPPPAPLLTVSELDRKVLVQWENNAENFTSTYAFEGYNIYIGSSSAGPWKRLATYDTPNELDIILQPTYDVNTGLILNMPAAYGNNLGLKYRYLFAKDYNDLTMANGHPYYILVTSYAYDANSLPNVLESSYNVVTVTPHKPRPGIVYSNDALETVKINHTAGQADPRKYEIWVYVVDPLHLETADYKVIVNEDESWTLLKNNVEVPGYVNRTDNIIDKDIEHKSLLDDSLDFFFGVSLDFHEQQLITYDPELISGNASILDGFTSPYRLNQASTDLAIDGQFKKGTRNPDYINNSLQIRFTGVMDSSTMEVVSGGSMATLAFSFGDPAFFMPNHPKNPNPGSRDPFLVKIPFEVWDVNRDVQLNVSFTDTKQKLADSAFVPTWAPRGKCIVYAFASEYDEQVHNNTYSGTDTMATWSFSFDETAVWQTGDIIQLTVPDPDTFPKPVVAGVDEFSFSLQGETKGVLADAKKRLDIINVYPNPYLAHNLLETGLHQEHVRFINLPEECTIRIFSIAGQLIKTIEHNDPNSTTHNWNLRNENNLPVASGFYIAHIKAPGIGEKILKMAVIFRKQRLKNL